MKYTRRIVLVSVVLLGLLLIAGCSNVALTQPTAGQSRAASGSITLNSWQANSYSNGLNVWNGAVGSWSTGAWIEFSNVNLGSGYTQASFNLATTVSGSFAIRLDSASGSTVGTLNYGSTGGWNSYNNQSCSLNGATGTHNLYIVDTSGAANLGTITIQGGSGGSTGGGSTGGGSSGGGTGGGTNGYVYLTFDDGPNNGTSPSLVNTLKSNGVNAATMFVIGQNIASNPTGWNAYLNSGFSLQNHTWTHSHMLNWSYQQVYNELQECNQAIQNAGKPKPTKLRLPYLESNSTIQAAASAAGLQIVSPTVDSQDWYGASVQQIINNVSNLQAGGNPLMHDWPQNTITALPTIIQNLKNRGLGFAQY